MTHLIGFVIITSLALALLKATIQVALILLLGWAIWLGVTRPMETAGLLLLFTILGLLNRHPIIGMLAFVSVVALGLVSRPR